MSAVRSAQLYPSPRSDKLTGTLNFHKMTPEGQILDLSQEDVCGDDVCKDDVRKNNPRNEDLRGEIDHLISIGNNSFAVIRMDALWRQQPTLATAGFISLRIDKLRDGLKLQTLRLAFLRSFTLEPVIPLLRAAAFNYHLDLQIHVGGYNAYMQEILDQDSSFYRFSPDAAVLAVRTADIAPEFWQDYSALEPTAIPEVTKRVCGQLEQAITAFRERSRAALIMHTLEQPQHPALGVLDSQMEISQLDAIQTLNREIRRMARDHTGVYVLDYDALVARHGRLLWQDDRKMLSVGLPIAANQLIHLTNELLRFLVPLSGRIVKVLVVDLDNTLWGGVIGEDGMNGIKLDAEYPGAAYQALQKAMLDVARRGILLAICSKNNPDDAMEVLQKHPGMLLRPSDFNALRINWNNKVQGLREIAAELNIGIDSLAFLDDSPFEREQVRNALPEVLVLDLPKDAMQYASVVCDCPAFERLTLSTEDRQRSTFYAERRQRAEVAQNFESKEDFFRYLEQEAEIALLLPATLARVSQLTQKTNQFNLTTRRYSEQQLAEIAARPGCQVLSMQVRDRFGDHGLVGVAITLDKDDLCEIEAFLLSCRVIGRSIETALISHLATGAVARGRKQMAGWFLPTKKNAPAEDFFSRSGFECISQNCDGSRWVLDLQKYQVNCPDWIKLTASKGSHF
ncbi:MAG: HAD-IIIC family phosphatase [Candidatus Sulfotelmatobacter sp.]